MVGTQNKEVGKLQKENIKDENQIATEKERKDFCVKFQIKEVKESGEDDEGNFGFFEGFASTFGNLDFVNDRIEAGAFKKTIKDNDQFRMLWQHRSSELIGSFTEAKETDEGLFVKGRINLGTQKGKEALALLKAGDLDSMSIGFFIMEQEFEGKGDDLVRVIKEVELFEISLVTFPANGEALVTDVKQLNQMKTLAEVEKYLRSKGITRNESTAIVGCIKRLGNQCDADDQPTDQCDAEPQLNGFAEEIRSITKLLKENQNV